ncbi:dephospho-CoA kinase [Pseudoalteromonas sp. T1lg65]|uniref:dephospho-CoA kinase n=1 Tax=Pseudoalteromonas sp. T1lg65 TaxID=2077101 RepID=UPI003F7A9E1E
MKLKNWIVGITGGIGAGKSALTHYLEQQGIIVVDADVVARDVVAPNTEGLKQIVAHFGEQILHADGTLNRAKLREIIFTKDEEKTWLNNLMHPLIRNAMIEQLESATSPYVVLSAPLLFENNLQQYCDKTLLVDVPIEIQVARTCARDNVDETQVHRIIDAQMSREEKQQHADIIINNNRPLDGTLAELAKLHMDFIKQAKPL